MWWRELSLKVVTGMGEACRELGNRALSRRPGRVAYSTLKLAQALPLNTLPSYMITLALSDNRVSKMKNTSFPGLGFLIRSPWFPQRSWWCLLPMPQQGDISMVCAATPDRVDACRSCGCPWSVQQLEAMLVSVPSAISGNYVDVCDLCC